MLGAAQWREVVPLSHSGAQTCMGPSKYSQVNLNRGVKNVVAKRVKHSMKKELCLALLTIHPKSDMRMLISWSFDENNNDAKRDHYIENQYKYVK